MYISKHRDISIDTISGIMIIMVILGHALQWCELDDSRYWDFTLHCFFYYIPWFFYKSGLFHKSADFVTCFKRNFKSIALPFISFWVLSFIVYGSCVLSQGVPISQYLKDSVWSLFIGSGPGNSALWFLLSLFLVKIIANRILKLFKPVAVVLFCTLILLLVDWLRTDSEISKAFVLYHPEFVYNTIIGLLFYTLGYLFRNLREQKIVFFVSIITYIVIVLFDYSYVDVFHNKLQCGNYLLWIICSVAGINVLQFIIKYVISKVAVKPLIYLGQNSMTFFAAHFIVGKVVKYAIISQANIENPLLQFLIYILAFSVILPLLNRVFHLKYLRFFIGIY